MSRTLCAIALVAYAKAMGSSQDREVEYAEHITENYMGYDQTHTDYWHAVYDHEDLAGAETAMNQWYEEKVKPVLDNHRDLVTRFYLGKAEKDNGQLLATCDAGTKCRNDNEAEFMELIEKEWKKVVTSFRTNVEDAIDATERLVNEGWLAAVKCEETTECCMYDPTSWEVIQTKLKNKVNTLIEKRRQSDEIMRRITEMKTKCEEDDYPVPWEEYDRKAEELDARAASLDVEVRDQMTLDEEIWEEGDYCVHPTNLRWTEPNPLNIGAVEDISYPAEFCLNNQLSGVMDSQDNRYDWYFSKGGYTPAVNADGRDQDVFESWPLDTIRKGVIRYQNTGTPIVRYWAFYDADGNLVAEQDDERSWETESVEFTLAEHERIVGVKGTAKDHEYKDKVGYWTNIQFAIAS